VIPEKKQAHSAWHS